MNKENKNRGSRKLVAFKCICKKAEEKESLVYNDECERCSCNKKMKRQVGRGNLSGFDKFGRSK